MKNRFLLLLTCCCSLLILTQATAQNAPTTTSDSMPLMSFSTAKEYEVGGIKVSGAKFSDENAIINISGLKVGSKIKIPGSDLPRAIKALWKLHLFTDVQVVKERTAGDVIFLEIVVKERPSLTTWSYEGVKKSFHEDLNGLINRFLLKGAIVTESNKTNSARAIEKFFREKGYLDSKVTVKEVAETKRVNAVKLVFDINRMKRVRIQAISFEGNKTVSASKLRKQLDKTKRKSRIFASSKLVKDLYEEDKKKMIKYYTTLGYRDAKIVEDSIWRETDGDLQIKMKIDEGKRYYFRNINWKGNSIYESKVLAQVLGLGKGDVYNQELLENRLKFSQDGRDVSSLYMDNGYLFFNVEPTEVAITGDSIDLEMRIFEGPQATIDKVTIKGNERTHEHVIRRELRTLPGEKFSRSEIIRSQREIINLGYFNQEALGINTPVNPQRGTVDIEYKVEEKPSDQLELSAGWGGFGVVGTLGISFNNFSMRNLFKKSAWSPLPQGDGQRLSIRAQSNGRFFQSYSASFSEPWLGGKRPTNFTTAVALTKYGSVQSVDQGLDIGSISVSLGRRLKWPDDYFISTTTLEYQRINLVDYPGFFQGLNTGLFNNINIQQSFTRSSIQDPLFPKGGSKFTLFVQATPPYSLFTSDRRYSDETIQEKFKLVEGFKWKFAAEWYSQLGGKFVLKTAAKIGSIGYYNKNVGYSPFGRFRVGGDGLANRQFGLTGNELIALRGYTDTDIPATAAGGGTTYAKYTAELRYPISLNPSSTIYALAFAEGGNAWADIRDFKPFDLRRAAGMGVRVFLPMFGTLGFDYGVGFDKPELKGKTWSDYGRFSIILGFEPD